MRGTTSFSNGSERFAINIFANLLSFTVSIMIGVWFTPYLIHHLGIAAYGLIPLTTTVINYFGLATIALNGAVGRFLTIAIERGDSKEASNIFNTALFGNIILDIVLFVPAIIISTHANSFLNVPEECKNELPWLFMFLVASFFLTTLSSSFSLASYCRNRFELSTTVEVVSNITRVGTVIILFTCFTPRVLHIGIGAIFGVLVSFMGSIIIWRYLIPTMHISFHDFKVSTFRSLTCIGGWFFVTQLGSLLFLSIDLIVVNRMLGADASGRYGAILQWSALLRSLAGVMAGVFGPTIFMLYARQDIPGLVRYAQQAVRFLGIIMALPIGLICGFSNALLSVWLGPDYSSLSPLMTLLTIHLSVNLGVLPLFNIRVATKKVRVPGIVLCIMGIMNLSLAILFAGPFGWGLYGVAGASAIILTLGNLVFGPWYAAYILAVPRSTFFRGTLPNILLTLGFTTVCGIMAHYCHIHTWIGLASGGFLLAITYCVFIYFIYMTILERQALRSIVRRSVNHFKS